MRSTTKQKKSRKLSLNIEGLITAQESGLLVIIAISEIKDLGSQVKSGSKWVDRCAAAAEKLMGESFRLRS